MWNRLVYQARTKPVHDLATLVNVAHGDPVLRELSTSPSYEVAVGRKTLQYNNTNGLVKNPTWDIGLPEDRLHLGSRSLLGDAG